MKKLILIFGLLLFTANCSTQNIPKEGDKVSMRPEKNDDGEWDIEVLDSQWSYFLNAIAKPMNMYSESYLKTKNSFLVS